PEPDRAVDLVADPEVLEPLGATVSSQDRRVADQTITTGMEASPVRIDAEPEADVGRVVLAQDRFRLFLVDLELGRRRLAEPFRVDGIPGIRRVGDAPGHRDGL